MEQITRGQAVRVGVDLAKRVIQVHAVDGAGRVLVSRALARDKFIAWCAQLPAAAWWPWRPAPAPTTGRASSSHWAWTRASSPRNWSARTASKAPAARTTPTTPLPSAKQRRRPQMHFVPVKRIEQQSMLCVHRLREGFKAERTACINRIRGLLAEFGLVFAQEPCCTASRAGRRARGRRQ